MNVESRKQLPALGLVCSDGLYYITDREGLQLFKYPYTLSGVSFGAKNKPKGVLFPLGH
jgi:hypothetical protein